jgi:hypothetical protein
LKDTIKILKVSKPTLEKFAVRRKALLQKIADLGM